MKLSRRRTLPAVAALTIGLAAAPAQTSAHPGHQSFTANISLNAFSPAEISITSLDTVNWVWRGPDTNHSVTADPGQSESFDSDPGRQPNHSVGDNFVHAFVDVGRFTYHCKVHPFMRGTIVVTDPYKPVVAFLAVRPRSLCSGGRCPKPKLKVAVDEPSTLTGVIERRNGASWRRVTKLPATKLRLGPNTVRLPAKNLKPGEHRVSIRVRDGAGNRSRVRRTAFTVVPG